LQLYKQMKLLLLFFVFSSVLFSCSKSLEIPPETIKTTTSATRTLVRNLDSTVLTVTIAPVVVCYSYANGSFPRPCDAFVEITCTLSRPIQASVSVKLMCSDKAGTTASGGIPSQIGFQMAPNTKQVVTRENLNGYTKEYATDMYSISSVSVYKMIH
jgi:hypothetical protein